MLFGSEKNPLTCVYPRVILSEDHEHGVGVGVNTTVLSDTL